MNSLPNSIAGVSLGSLIDINYILINRIFVLAVVLLFFCAVLLLRRVRHQDADSEVTGPIKLSLFGFVLLYAELALAALPRYQSLLQGAQTVVVLLSLARLINFLAVDVYLRLHTRREVPSFLRDSVRLVVYLAVGIISLRLVFKIDLSAIVTTTTVITATIAFAMQNTISNALSGFSIQSDRLLERGNWITIKEKGIFGEIVNIGFRYTTLRNPDQHLFMVPNSLIMQNVVTCHGNGDGQDPPLLQFDVMLGYELPPEKARELLLRVLHDSPDVLAQPLPAVRIGAFNDSGITYQLKYAIADQGRRTPVLDALYGQVWYAVHRAGYNFPYPHRQIVTAETAPPFRLQREQVQHSLRAFELFTPLDEATVARLADQAVLAVYGGGEVVVRQGEEGCSLFLVLSGTLEVAIDGAAVGSIASGSFFGEMSLLTGEPRMATVRASSEVWLAEITKETLLPVLRETPAVQEAISAILAQREQRSRANLAVRSDVPVAAPRSEDYLRRLKEFFSL